MYYLLKKEGFYEKTVAKVDGKTLKLIELYTLDDLSVFAVAKFLKVSDEQVVFAKVSPIVMYKSKVTLH